MGLISKIFSKFSSKEDIEKLEEEADDVLELHDNFRLLRVNGEAVYVDDAKGKIIIREKDTLPNSPARAALEAMKKIKELKQEKAASKELWTCGFRDTEERWTWYRNTEPRMTVSFKEAFKNGSLEDKFYFHSAKFGVDTIEKIKTIGMVETAKAINSIVLENPYTELECKACGNSDNYTIDDLVTKDKQASYESNLVVCSSCENLIELK